MRGLISFGILILITGFLHADPAYDSVLDPYYNNDYEFALNKARIIEPPPSYVFKLSVLKRNILLNQNRIGKPKKISHSDPQYRDYLQYLYYLELLDVGNIQTAKKVYESMASINRNPFLVKSARIEMSRFYLKTRQYKEAERIIQRVIAQKNKSVIYKESLKVSYEIALAQRDQVEALRRYVQLVLTFPEEDRQDKEWKRLNNVFQNRLNLTDGIETPQEHRQYLNNLFRKQYYAKAEEQARYYLKRYPRSRDRFEVMFTLGQIYLHLYRYSQAKPLFKRVMNATVHRSLQERAMFYLGLSFEKSSQIDLAKRTYMSLLERFGDKSPMAPKTFLHLGKLYWHYGPYKNFVSLKQKFGRLYPRNRLYRQLSWEDEWSNTAFSSQQSGYYRRVKNLVEQSKLYTAIRDHYPGLTSQYLQGDQSFKNQMRVLPINYHVGQLLRQYYGRSARPSVQVLPKYNWLYDVGFGNLAIDELTYRGARSHSNSFDNFSSRATLMNQMDDYYKAIDILSEFITASEQQQLRLSPHLIKLAYPRAYWDIVKKYGKRYDVDPYLLLALMREESQFLPNSVLENNAKKRFGLFRLDTEIAKQLAFSLGKGWQSPFQLFDPENSIQYAAYYLSELKKRYNNNLYQVITAFHYDIQTANKFKSKIDGTYYTLFKAVPFVDFHDYVKNVVDHYLLYHFLYIDSDETE